MIVEAISVGSEHTLALTCTSDVYGWGSNTDGQLGLGQSQSVKEPQLLSTLSGKNIQQVIVKCFFEDFDDHSQTLIL